MEEEDTKENEIGEKMVVEGYMEIEDSTFHNSNFRLALLENVTFDQCDLSCELIFDILCIASFYWLVV